MKSLFVVFECKNYAEGIGQGEVLTTEKYLFPKAFSAFAVICTRKGFGNENARKFVQGTMRENGCLMLVLDDDDVIRMIDMRINGGDPSDCLYEKAMRFL